jgi:O-antigen/teichoic acid export membrane protein
MKPKDILSALTALWVFVVALEGASSVIRFIYSRKMHMAVRAVSGVVNYAKAALMVILAVSNVMLFMRHVDDKG